MNCEMMSWAAARRLTDWAPRLRYPNTDTFKSKLQFGGGSQGQYIFLHNYREQSLLWLLSYTSLLLVHFLTLQILAFPKLMSENSHFLSSLEQIHGCRHMIKLLTTRSTHGDMSLEESNTRKVPHIPCRLCPTMVVGSSQGPRDQCLYLRYLEVVAEDF